MSAADAFRLFSAMAGGEDGQPAALQSLIETTYDAIGWPAERVMGDLNALQSVLIESPHDLRRALSAGHQYQVESGGRGAYATNRFTLGSFPSPSWRSTL